MNPENYKYYGNYIGKHNLNLGCASNLEPGFINLDFYNKRADVLHDLETTPLPFADNYFDFIVGSHVFEHITRFIPLMNDLHRILRPGGALLAVTPYATSDGAIDAPQHCRYFTENTWVYFSQSLYKQERNHAGNGAYEDVACDFDVASIIMVPFPEFLNDPEIEFKRRHWRNVINEVHAVLIKK